MLSTRRDVHSAPAIGTMSSDSDKEPEEEEGIEEEDEYNFPHLSSGSSTGEETGNLFDFICFWNSLTLTKFFRTLQNILSFHVYKDHQRRSMTQYER